MTIWKDESESIRCSLKELWAVSFECPQYRPRRHRCKPLPEQYRLKNHPKYLSEFEIMKMLYALTGDEWEYHYNTSPFEKTGWKELGIVKAWYKWNVRYNNRSYASTVFTLPEKMEDLMLIPHAHASNPNMILNSGDTTPHKRAIWSIWYRKGAKLVDPRTINYSLGLW